MNDAREELGYVAPPAPASKPALALPELRTDQFRTLRRIQRGSGLDRNIWTLFARDEIARMKLIAPNEGTPSGYALTPLGVELLEREKGRRR